MYKYNNLNAWCLYCLTNCIKIIITLFRIHKTLIQIYLLKMTTRQLQNEVPKRDYSCGSLTKMVRRPRDVD